MSEVQEDAKASEEDAKASEEPQSGDAGEEGGDGSGGEDEASASADDSSEEDEEGPDEYEQVGAELCMGDPRVLSCAALRRPPAAARRCATVCSHCLSLHIASIGVVASSRRQLP